jgi:hypothetical protein
LAGSQQGKILSTSRRNDVASGFFIGALIGLTFGAFVRLFKMAIGLPGSAIALYSDPTQRFHFMYYPAAALTIVALVMVFGLGATGHPGMIVYGLFIGWIAGDLKYYSDKWHGVDGWLSWCPGAGYKKAGQYVIAKNDTTYTVLFALLTVLFAAWWTLPAWK